MRRVVFVMALWILSVFAGCGLKKESVYEEKIQSMQSAPAGTAVSRELTAGRTGLSEIGSTGYAYSTLKDQHKQLYLEIYQAMKTPGQTAVLSSFDRDVIRKVFTCVNADHPELFYVDGYRVRNYRSGGKVVRTELEPTVTMDAERIAVQNRLIEQAAAQWMADMPVGADDYGKLRFLYEKVVFLTEYGTDAPEGQNIQSVFLNGISVCQGYAKALQYLCLRSGIESVLVTGTANGERHAWLLAKLDGSWYHVDPTFGDPVYQSGQEQSLLPEASPGINYDYFCVTDAQIALTHQAADTIVWPVCKDVKNQYYRREGLLLESADPEQIRQILNRARQQGRESVTFQCADDRIYQEVYNVLIMQRRIFELIPGNRISYTEEPVQRTMTFWLAD